MATSHARAIDRQLISVRAQVVRLQSKLSNVRDSVGDLGLTMCHACATLLTVDSGPIQAEYCASCPVRYCQDCAIGQMFGALCPECNARA
jgi:hypothetical protein